MPAHIGERDFEGREPIESLTAAALIAMTVASGAQAQQGADFFKTRRSIISWRRRRAAATTPMAASSRNTCRSICRARPSWSRTCGRRPPRRHQCYLASRNDGLTIGTFNTGLIYNQLMQLPAAKFDLTKMSWVGKAGSDPRVFAIAANAPIKTWQDLISSKQPVKFATAGVGSASYVETVILTKALNLPIKLLTGYNGTEDMLAMRRGEIAGSIASRSSYDSFVANGYGRFIAQIGGDDKDVPQLVSFVKDEKAKALINLVQSQGDIARLTAGPPDIPRRSPRRAARRIPQGDGRQEAQAKAEKLGRPLEPGYGEAVLQADQGSAEPVSGDSGAAQGSHEQEIGGAASVCIEYWSVVIFLSPFK